MSNDKRKSWYKRPSVLSVIVAVLTIVVSIIIWLANPPSQPDFSISVSPMQGSVRQGGTTQTTVSVNGIYGYNYPVTLSSEQLPGLAIAFVPQSGEAAPGYTSTMTINAGLNVAASDYTIKVTGTGADGKEHVCKYTVTVQELPSPPPVEPYMVYSDIGIAAGDVWVWSGADWGLEPPILADGSYLKGNAPEGDECYAVTSGTGNDNYIGWGVFLGIFRDHELVTPHTMDLSGYNSLQFWVKTPVNLKVEIQENNAEGVKSSPCIISNYGWNRNLLGTWQRVTIPKSSFRNVNLTAIFCPFMITGNGSRVTFYIDEVVWVP